MWKSASEGSLTLLDSGGRPFISRMPAHSLTEDVQSRVLSREDTEKSSNANGGNSSIFVLQHLRQSPSNIFDFSEEQKHVEEITSTGAEDLSTPLARLLTKYSEIAYAYQPEERKPRYPLLFLKHPDNVPDGVAFNYKDSEDTIATPWSRPTHHQVLEVTNFRSVALYDAVSLIECKPLHEFGREQIVSYAYELFEVRPEICGTYTLWARPQYYEIMWVDASGVAVSPQFTWSDLAPLRHYVWSLYNPPDPISSLTRQ